MQLNSSDKRVKVRPVPGWKDYYVTENGEVYRVTKLTPTKTEKGYFRVRLNNGQKRIFQFVHRLVSSAFDKRRELNSITETVDHKDGNEGNNHRHNLEVVTNAVNIFRRDYGYNKNQTQIYTAGDPF